MFRKTSLAIFVFVFTMFGAWGQEANVKSDFLEPDQEMFNGLLERKSYDSAYRFLNTFNQDSLDYFLSWKNLAYGYWKEGGAVNMANSSAIAFWLLT